MGLHLSKVNLLTEICLTLFLFSLKERNLQLLAAAEAEEQEREQIQQDVGELQEYLLLVLPQLEVCPDPSKTQV